MTIYRHVLIEGYYCNLLKKNNKKSKNKKLNSAREARVCGV